jgi:hypothetical protein
MKADATVPMARVGARPQKRRLSPRPKPRRDMHTALDRRNEAGFEIANFWSLRHFVSVSAPGAYCHMHRPAAVARTVGRVDVNTPTSRGRGRGRMKTVRLRGLSHCASRAPCSYLVTDTRERRHVPNRDTAIFSKCRWALPRWGILGDAGSLPPETLIDGVTDAARRNRPANGTKS